MCSNKMKAEKVLCSCFETATATHCPLLPYHCCLFQVMSKARKGDKLMPLTGADLVKTITVLPAP